MSGHAERTTARLSAQHEVVRALAEAPALEQAAPRVLEAIGRALDWPLGLWWEIDEGTGLLRSVAHWSAPEVDAVAFAEASRGLTFTRGVGLPGRVWAAAEPVWLADLAGEEAYPRAQLAAATGLHAAVAFPVEAGFRVLGVIEFLADEVREPDVQVLELLTTFGRQLGIYAERRRMAARVREMEGLNAAMVASALDCVVAMDADGCVVEFNPAAQRTFGYSRQEAIGRELAGLIVPPALREPHRSALARFHETGDGPILGQRLELTGMRSDGTEFPVELTVVRIRGREPAMFTGFVRDITERRRAEAERGQLLQAEQAARRRAEDAERRSAHIARTLQRSLLPPNLPPVPGMAAASAFRAAGHGNEVGGDFYDVFDAGDGCWAAVIGDVQGKGPEAASVTALARYTVRAAAMREPEPSSVLRALNDALLRLEDEAPYCTVAYLRVRPHTGQAQLAVSCGGHPLPLLLRRDGTVTTIGEAGTLLGAFENPCLVDRRARMETGETLLLYTDGVTDVRTPSGRLGHHRLRRLLAGCAGRPAAEVAARLEAAVVDAPGHEARDDVAILVLQPEPEQGAAAEP